MPDAAQKPELSESEIHRWLMENYSIAGVLERLPGECDLNLKLSTADDGSFVCKISNEDDGLELLRAQVKVMHLLNQQDMAARPEILGSKSGESLTPLNVAGQRYVGRVLSFLPGQPMAQGAAFGEALLRDLGRTVGRVSQALAGYDHPAFHHQFDWDLANALDVVGRYRDLITDPGLRVAVDQIDYDFRTVAAPRLGRLKTSVIHNDANDHNVLVDGDRVTGLIDFGDMVHSHTICDLAIAMAYAVLGADNLLETIAAMAIGYHEVMPVEEEELAVLFPMLRMRLAVSVCMAAHQVRQRPGDPYLSISQQPIRKTLPKLLALDPKQVHHHLRGSLQ